MSLRSYQPVQYHRSLVKKKDFWDIPKEGGGGGENGTNNSTIYNRESALYIDFYLRRVKKELGLLRDQEGKKMGTGGWNSAWSEGEKKFSQRRRCVLARNRIGRN